MKLKDVSNSLKKQSPGPNDPGLSKSGKLNKFLTIKYVWEFIIDNHFSGNRPS